MGLPPPLIPLDEVALIDAAAAALGAPLAMLMERAGAGVAEEARRLHAGGAVLVACGPGHNGGDGYVCARHLAAAGVPVSVWPVVPPAAPATVEAAAALPAGVPRVTGIPSATRLVVDAMLGAGIRGRPRGPIAEAIAALRAARLPVLAVDVPSGLGSDLVLPAVRAVCLGAAKQPLIGSSACREFTTIDIGLPPAAVAEVHPACLRRFPPLQRDGHKGTHGELLIVGGGRFAGALEFACRAAVMTGCDLVRAWTAGREALPPTVVAHRHPGDELGPADPEELTPYLARAGAVLIGPGMGLGEPAQAAARQAFSLALELGVPVVIDADGLSACADALRHKTVAEDQLLLTPHRGECRRVLGADTDEAVHAFARPDRVVLAKGVVDLVSDGQRWQRNPRGNARMAVGGTGDVLAGLCAGLMARGASPFDAARMGVLWATSAGDRLWPERGPTYDALDLVGALPATLRALLEPQGSWPPLR